MTPIGSRRIHDVWPAMYSAGGPPSSTRAAPAKNRIWSTIGGISSLAVSAYGLPVFSRLEPDELVRARLDGVGELQQRPLALGRGGLAATSRRRSPRRA